jgi:hypothetical protein
MYDRIGGSIRGVDILPGLLNKILKDPRVIRVSPDSLDYSSYILYSGGFTCCNAVLLLDNKKRVGGLAHLSIDANLDKLFGGYQSRWKRSYGIKEKYGASSFVKAVNIFHNARSAIPKADITKTLVEEGVEEIIHLPVISYPGPDNYLKRDVVFEVENGLAYVFYESIPAPDIITIF